MEREICYDQRWFRHGVIEVQFTPVRKSHNKWVYFNAKNTCGGPEFEINSGELSLLFSLDTNQAKNLSQISEDFAKWTDRIKEDNGCAKSFNPLSREVLYWYMKSIESKFGFGVFKKVGQGLWRLTSK